MSDIIIIQNLYLEVTLELLSHGRLQISFTDKPFLQTVSYVGLVAKSK